ncbi:MAG: hypothetical protein RBT11_18660 [Desulfobacterales bacterium]|jgi:hypothetical protein|nr:hypothetical protein [Desulfobacterales bacterium]
MLENTLTNAPSDDVVVASAKIAQEIEEALEEHGKKLGVIANLLIYADSDVFGINDFNIDLGTFILDLKEAQDKVIEEAVEKYKGSHAYVVYRAEFVLKNLQAGGKIDYWGDEIREMSGKLKKHIGIMSKSNCAKEIELLQSLSKLLE